MQADMTRIAIIGAGQVGATTAMRIAESGLADVVMVDIVEGLAAGKALDLMHAAPLVPHNSMVEGSDDFSRIRGAGIVVVTAGLPRMPGMTREELLEKNADIMKSVAGHIRQHCPESIVLVVSNPLDVMTYLCLRLTGFPRERVIGMAGVLDSARFISHVAGALEVKNSKVRTMIIGSHGDSMIPLVEHTSVKGTPIREVLDDSSIHELVERTRNAGAEIVSCLRKGSAFYAPAAAILKMVRCMLEDSDEVLPASVLLEGEYSLSDVCIGVPVRLCSSGLKEIVKLELSDADQRRLEKSAAIVKVSIACLKEKGYF